MPKPEMAPVEKPAGRGSDVAPYLASFGIVDRIPAIRSTDHNIVRRCPFSYYLTRRLGLVPALSLENSTALNVGSYVHLLYEVDGDTDTLDRVHKERLDEIKQVCREVGEDPTKYIQEERVDVAQAAAVYRAAHAYAFPFDRKTPLKQHTLNSYLDTRFKPLENELLVSYRDQNFPKACLTMQADRLLYEPAKDLLWVLDYKTTSMPPKKRAAVCEFEFQARHYLHITEGMLPQLRDRYDLPSSTKVGGIIHAVLYKPNLQFGQSDRPYVYSSIGLRSKKNGVLIPVRDKFARITHYLGEIKDSVPPFDKQEEVFHSLEKGLEWLHKGTEKKPEKQYDGEPSIDLYTSRIQEAYDSYLFEVDGAPVCLVETPMDVAMDGDARHEYDLQLKEIYHYATCKPMPCMFPRSEGGVRRYKGGNDAYYPFYVMPPATWPDIIHKFKFVQRWRDNENQKDN
jgi:hypothetical protein